MRILILATDIYRRGGIARYTYTFASALADLLGPDNVSVFALLDCGDPSDLHPGFRVLGPVTDRLTAGAEIRFAIKALALARDKYDLIVCTHLSLAPVAAAIRFVHRIPFWVVCHGSEAWSPLSYLKHAALRRSRLLLPISRFTAEKLSEIHGIPPERLFVLHNAIPEGLEKMLTAPPCPACESKARDGERILLSVGSLESSHAYKGFDTVIRALPAALKRVPRLSYLIVGDGDDRARLERLTAELQLESHVKFAGSVSDGQLAKHYRSCDVFVLPSKLILWNGSWEGEGFGRVYVEAALAGKPVIGSSTGGAAEAVLPEKTGLLVDPPSEEQTARAIVELLENPKVAEEMGGEGREWAMENFTQQALRRRLAELLQLDGGARSCRPWAA